MQVMSRDFTLKEKILLIILVTLLIGLLYYYVVDQPVRTSLEQAQQQKENIQSELDVLQMKISLLQRMKEEMDALLSNTSISKMESYNNAKKEIKLLNDILMDSEQYDISFSDVSRTGDQIRRNVVLRFTVASYEKAKKILTELSSSEYRCLISDITVDSKHKDLEQESISVSLAATFYETMVDGVPDSGLPEDTSTEGFGGEDLRKELEGYDY